MLLHCPTSQQLLAEASQNLLTPLAAMQDLASRCVACLVLNRQMHKLSACQHATVHSVASMWFALLVSHNTRLAYVSKTASANMPSAACVEVPLAQAAWHYLHTFQCNISRQPHCVMVTPPGIASPRF